VQALRFGGKVGRALPEEFELADAVCDEASGRILPSISRYLDGCRGGLQALHSKRQLPVTYFNLNYMYTCIQILNPTCTYTNKANTNKTTSNTTAPRSK
jgi:hypothetical protein